MKIIKKIEVNYLRSLYSATLEDTGDLNVVFGRNDSGKSNLLRALNLFFNDEIEPERGLDFELDMSDRRKQEARDAKGRQFIWIKITFNVPRNYHGSLGTEIAVKRQWNRDGDVTQTVFPPTDGAGKQSRLTRLLNEIDFTYIPAIKDLNVYADLIERMYGAASETAALIEATSKFVDAIEGQTTELSTQLTTLFGSPARLAPPTEMSQLFRNLDFAHGDDGHSLLRQKGDGVKARHIPELLRYINNSETRKKFYLWGFEEPENSLDLGAAEAEAGRFCQFANRPDTQIFITSHSPAFYLASNSTDSSIRRFFITKQVKGASDAMEPGNAASRIDDLDDAEMRMEQAGLLQLPFVIRRMTEQKAALVAKEEEAEKLRSELMETQQPTLYVEGTHDADLFTSAMQRIGQDTRIAVKPLGGTPSTTDALLSAVLRQGGLSSKTPVMFLFDNDKAGRLAFKKLCSGSPTETPSHFQDKIFVWALNFTDEFRQFLKKRSIQADQAFFTAEFMYPGDGAAKLCKELVDAAANGQFEDWKYSINGDYWHSLGQRNCQGLSKASAGSVEWFFARGVPDSLKKRFSQEANVRGFDTTHIDEIAKKIADKL